MTRPEQTKQRLSLLQDWLRAHQLAGIFVPRTDFWQGEEVMACDARLEWLTGFTGSAGMALVLQSGTGLFVDGRYTLQAPVEVADTPIEVCHMVDKPWQEWIGGIEGTFAVDGKHVTCGWVDRARGLLKGRNSQLQLLDSNPIDTIWIDQPAPRFTPVEIFPLERAGETSLSKRQRLGAELAKRNVDGAFITDPTGIAWLLNIRAQDYLHTPVALSVLFFNKDGSGTWFTDPSRVIPDVLTHIGEGIQVEPPSAFVTDTGRWKDTSLLLDEMTAAAWLRDKLIAAGATIKLDRCITALAKACKNAVELDGMHAAHRRDGVALGQFLNWFAGEIAPGTSDVKESDITDKLADCRRGANEYRGPSFDTICGFGPSGAIVHYHTTATSDVAVTGDSLLLLDSGGQYLDGTTDITRTLAVGNASDDHKRHYTLVLKGHIALSSVRFPAGTTGHQLDALARAPLWAEGLNYDHGTGHGVGHFLSVHEGPQGISPRASGIELKPGMILSNEPGYYRTGQYGIRIENLIAVKESATGADGRKFLEFETLTLAPYDRSLILPELLTVDERAWLDNYHARVLAEIGPQLDDAARHWLQQACAPLS